VTNLSGVDPFASGKVDNGTPAGDFLLAGQPVSGAAPYSTLLGTTNLQALLALPPPAFTPGTPGYYSPTGQVYLANAVDLFITNDDKLRKLRIPGIRFFADLDGKLS